MWSSLKKILPRAVNKLDLGPVLEFNQLVISWDGILAAVFGEAARNKSKPISLKKDTLLVDCLNSTWAAEMQFKSEQITAKANQILKKDIVKKIRFIS